MTTDLADRVILMRGADEIERPLEDTSDARRLRGVLDRFAERKDRGSRPAPARVMNSRRTLPGSAADRAKALIDLWHAKRGDRALPSRKDFDVLELKPWLGEIEIVEVEHGPPMRFRYRLVGTSIVDIDGMDITGQYADEVFPDKMAGVTGEYVQAIETRGPIETQLERPNAKGFIAPYHKLVLPLSSDGDGIDMLIVLLIELERMDAPKRP